MFLPQVHNSAVRTGYPLGGAQTSLSELQRAKHQATASTPFFVIGTTDLLSTFWHTISLEMVLHEEFHAMIEI